MSQSKRKEYINSLEERKFMVSEAMEFLQSAPKVKFNESIDVAINLGIDPSKSDQNMRGATLLPAGSGKPCKVAVFVEGDQASAATEAGADAVGMDDLAEELKKGEVDFDVVIATPDKLHAEQTIAAANAGKHVLVEKPMATTVEDADAMIQACRSADVRLGVAYHLRWHLGHRALAGGRHRGEPGDIRYPPARWTLHATQGTHSRAP